MKILPSLISGLLFIKMKIKKGDIKKEKLKKYIIILAGAMLLFLLAYLLVQKDIPEKEIQTPQLPVSNLNKEGLGIFAQKAVSGGPLKDGIPSIDNPKFISMSEADKWLDDNDIVFGVVKNGIVKAYPQRILVWHEIVNDDFNGKKVSVTYCPLTGTSIGYKRTLDGIETEFGVSGKLVNNNLIMYDRLTDSYWPQILGTAVTDPLLGSRLEEFPVIWTTWDKWKRKYPETLVLSKNTGQIRNYDNDPYGNYNPSGGYYIRDGTIFPNLAEDKRFSDKTVVIGARLNGGALAVLKDTIRQEKVINTNLANTPLLILYDNELDTARFFKRTHNGKILEFTLNDGLIIDEQTNNVLTVEGYNEKTGEQLEQINAFDAMWFAWAAFYPTTEVYYGES